MYIPDKLQINKFEEVALPSLKSMFSRIGEVKPESLDYSGDDVVPESMRKVDSIADYEAYAEQMSREASQKSE